MNKNLEKLKTKDIYSLILFIVFQLKKIPEYAVLSELIYLVDKNSLLNMCSYLGGNTITIPTLEELEDVTNALLLYSYINIENKSFEDGIKALNLEDVKKENIKNIYLNILDIMKEYNINVKG